jgi:hypothetical protein
MTMTRSTDLLTAARAEALFASGLSAGSPLSHAVVHAAITHAVHTYGGTRGCAGEMAAAYGEHPETAATRMRWARHVIEATYSPPVLDRARPASVPKPRAIGLKEPVMPLLCAADRRAA